MDAPTDLLTLLLLPVVPRLHPERGEPSGLRCQRVHRLYPPLPSICSQAHKAGAQQQEGGRFGNFRRGFQMRFKFIHLVMIKTT